MTFYRLNQHSHQTLHLRVSPQNRSPFYKHCFFDKFMLHVASHAENSNNFFTSFMYLKIHKLNAAFYSNSNIMHIFWVAKQKNTHQKGIFFALLFT